MQALPKLLSKYSPCLWHPVVNDSPGSTPLFHWWGPWHNFSLIHVITQGSKLGPLRRPPPLSIALLCRAMASDVMKCPVFGHVHHEVVILIQEKGDKKSTCPSDTAQSWVFFFRFYLLCKNSLYHHVWGQFLGSSSEEAPPGSFWRTRTGWQPHKKEAGESQQDFPFLRRSSTCWKLLQAALSLHLMITNFLSAAPPPICTLISSQVSQVDTAAENKKKGKCLHSMSMKNTQLQCNHCGL